MFHNYLIERSLFRVLVRLCYCILGTEENSMSLKMHFLLKFTPTLNNVFFPGEWRDCCILLWPKPGHCPMTGHWLFQCSPPHIGRSISVWRSHDKSQLPVGDRPLWPMKFEDHPPLLWRKTDCRLNCLWKVKFVHLDNVIYNIIFCGCSLLHMCNGISSHNQLWNDSKCSWNRRWNKLCYNCDLFQSTNISGVAWAMISIQIFLQKFICVKFTS